MFRWAPYAMVRVTLVFVAGILTAIYQPALLSPSFARNTACSAALAYLLLWVYLRRQQHLHPLRMAPRGRWVLSVTALVSLFLLGAWCLHSRTYRYDPRHFMHQPIARAYIGSIAEAPTSKPRSWRTVVEVEHIQTQDGWQPARGRVLLYLRKQEPASPVEVGDRLLVKGNPVALAPPGNPGEFDYQRFLSFRHLYHQHFRDSTQYRVVYTDGASAFDRWRLRARAAAQRQLILYLENPQSQAIAQALVLGITDAIDNELQQAYAASGAMHVLAVSGLHVGILYALLLWLLKPLRASRRGRWLLAGCSLLVLWAYAAVTGFSPSVLRAVTMFSFVALAQPLGWRTQIYNTLAASAFVLLLANPYLIMSVGFQLSYMAVLGIVTLQRPLYLLWEAPNGWLDKVWQITTVSLGAQAGTFALGLLYFHQFPVYFLFSNLFVIPGATLALVGGLLVLALAVWAPAAEVAGSLLNLLIEWLNRGVHFVERLPGSKIDDVFISTLQVWLLMGCVVCIALVFLQKNFRPLPVAALLALLLAGLQWDRHRSYYRQPVLAVYRVAGAGAVQILDRGTAWFWSDTTLVRNAEALRFHIRPHRMLHGATTIRHENAGFADSPGWQMTYRGHTMVRLTQRKVQLPDVATDFLMISHNAIADWEMICQKMKPKWIIFDGTNHLRYIERERKRLASQPVRIHSVLHQGAFVFNLPP